MWTLPDGGIDAPAADTDIPRGLLEIYGWALFPSGPAARIDLTLGTTPLGPARLGMPRPDVQQATGAAGGVAAGFELVADLAGWPEPDGETALRASATGVGGERRELPPIPVRVTPVPSIPAPAAPAAPAARAATDAQRLAIVTHNLGLGGAQTWLLDLLRAWAAEAPLDGTILTPIAGPLLAAHEELGLRVHISPGVPFDDLARYEDRVEELAGWFARERFDVALVNTFSVFGAADAATRAGVPLVWGIHESNSPAVQFHNSGAGLDPAVEQRGVEAFGRAAWALFEAEATRQVYLPHLAAERCVTIPYALDIDRIDAERRGLDRDAARRALGIPDGDRLVICVGTIERRKAQIPLLHAFALVADRHPQASLALVGARGDAYSGALEAFAADRAPAGRVRVVPLTPEIAPWFAAADLLVCASDVESLPRVALEAMAWEVPVLATAIFGLPDLIDDGVTGWLCPPRDVRALADALDRALGASDAERRDVARAARRRLEERHALAPYARAVGRLLTEARDGR